VNTSREAFRVAHDVSAYSLVALARGASPLMTEGRSIVAMSYYGAEKVVPHYNVMGVAKSRARSQHALPCLRSGPKENSCELHQRRAGEHAGGARHRGLHGNAQSYEARSPLKRNLVPEELGATVFSSQVMGRGHYGPDGLRGLRLPDYGDVKPIHTRKGK